MVGGVHEACTVETWISVTNEISINKFWNVKEKNFECNLFKTTEL